MIETTEDGQKQDPITLGGGNRPDKPARLIIELVSDDERTVRLVSYVPKFEKLETGTKPQSLENHVKLVRDYANDIIRRLDLKPVDPSDKHCTRRRLARPW